MIGIPVKEKVKGFEDGENYNGWETKEARQKDKSTPAQKLAKKKELQDKLIDCGFSLKAASSIALQEISQKYSYWVDGYNAAVGMRDPETGQWHMDVGFDPKLTHGAVTSDYINDLGTPSMRNMIKDKESRTDYYNNHTARGLYNPKTKDFIHFSHPDAWDEKEFNFKDLTSSQRKQMEKFWKDLAEQNGIVIDTLRILNNQSGHFEDLDVSDLEMPEEIREQMAKKNLTLKTLDERVDRVRELEAEGLSSSEALNKMTLEEWELKYKKEFERGGKYVYASKWKIVAKGYVTKRSNFINHRRVGFIPGKMIHHKHYSDLKGHQKAVQHYGPLKTHNVRNFKKESVLNEDQAQELFGQQPYMYHDVAAARTKKGNNSQIPIINSIFKNGILPKEQTGVSEYDDWLTSRPEHVYLGEERFYPKNAVPALRIDMSKVDPHTLAPDEDLFPVYGYNNQHAHRLDFNDIKSPPFEKEHPEGATLGNWAHEHSHLDTPKNVRASKELMGSISVNGGVPADASHFNPPWLDKVEFDIRENMEDPESDLEDDRHLMDLILSNQERISEDGDSDYLSRMMDLYNELYEEVQKRKQMYKRQSKWKIAKPNLVPSEGVRSAARRGIKYHAEGKAGDGFEAATLDRAHKIANGEELTPEHVKRMHSFFERHAGGRSQKAKKGEITPWDVAWLAWGGTAGRSWAASKVRELENSEKTSKKKCECWEGYKRVLGTKPCEPGSCEKCDKAHKQSKWKLSNVQFEIDGNHIYAIINNKIVGDLEFINYDDDFDGGKIVEIEFIRVDKQHRRTGIGKLLLEKLYSLYPNHEFQTTGVTPLGEKLINSFERDFGIDVDYWGEAPPEFPDEIPNKNSKWKVAKPNLVPSEGVRSAARRGIKYHAEGKAGDGFEAATLDRAHKIANGEELTPEHVKRMHSFFERHAGGRSQKAKKGEITPWDVAWLAWGGTAGRSWAASKVRELENSEKTSKKKCECWEGYKRVPGTKPCEPGSCEKCDKAHKQSKWKIADHQGWTNYETWNVNAMMLNDYELNKHFHNLVVNKASGNQFIADAIGLVIGPHNKQLQEDFSSMSDDEEVEMQKQNQEEDWWRNAEKQHPDDYLAQEAYVRQMKEITMTFMGEPQPTDIADYWIDESKVNWKEIYNYWKSNAEAEGNQIISKWKIC